MGKEVNYVAEKLAEALMRGNETLTENQLAYSISLICRECGMSTTYNDIIEISVAFCFVPESLDPIDSFPKVEPSFPLMQDLEKEDVPELQEKPNRFHNFLGNK